MSATFPNKGGKVKRANKFETPGPETEIHGNITDTGRKILVSMIEDSPTAAQRKSIFPRSLESLKRTSLKITDFHITVDNESL